MLDWSISYLEKGLRAGILEPTQEKAQRDLRNVHKHPKGGCKEGRARLFFSGAQCQDEKQRAQTNS